MDLRVRPLDAETWKDFERLALRYNGVWGGCWCMAFHPEGVGKGHTVEGNREAKRRRVLEGKAHASLVYSGEEAVGWCQFGSPDELPRIKMRREYEALAAAPPAWRITCFFVAPDFRGRGVAAHALDGALGLMKGMGGGLVESFPQETGEARAYTAGGPSKAPGSRGERVTWPRQAISIPRVP